MQALERTFAILRAVANHGRSAGVSDVARATGLAKSTVSRTLVALEAQGAVDRVDDSGRYVIGTALARLTADAPMAGLLRDIARPELIDLSAQVGEAAALAVPDGDEVLYLVCEQADTTVQVQDWTGERFAFHVVAAGLAVMTGWSQERVDAYAEGGLIQPTDRSISSRHELEDRLTAARDDEVAWTMQEFSDEINGVGAAVHDPQGRPVGALTVYGPEFRFPGSAEQRDAAADATRKAAARVSATLASP